MASENEANKSSAIDETPIIPIDRPGQVRRHSLEKHLQHRPDPQELKDRHILLETNAAPALQAKAQELERQRVSDNLKKGLEKRPEKSSLVERNILPATNAAPGIVGPQKELEKHMLADNLNEKIARRPNPGELVKEGVLKTDPTTPSDETDAGRLYEERMEEEYAKREGGA